MRGVTVGDDSIYGMVYTDRERRVGEKTPHCFFGGMHFLVLGVQDVLPNHGKR